MILDALKNWIICRRLSVLASLIFSAFRLVHTAINKRNTKSISYKVHEMKSSLDSGCIFYTKQLLLAVEGTRVGGAGLILFTIVVNYQESYSRSCMVNLSLNTL